MALLGFHCHLSLLDLLWDRQGPAYHALLSFLSPQKVPGVQCLPGVPVLLWFHHDHHGRVPQGSPGVHLHQEHHYYPAFHHCSKECIFRYISISPTLRWVRNTCHIPSYTEVLTSRYQKENIHVNMLDKYLYIKQLGKRHSSHINKENCF